VLSRSEIPSVHQMFLLRKQATENENGVTDGTLLTLYHGMSRTLILWHSIFCVLRDHNQVIDMFIAVDGHMVHRLSGYVLAKNGETDTVEE